MHIYKRNISEYHQKAFRLSLLQHGVYCTIIDACYDSESFPGSIEQAADWIGAKSPDELQAVKFVLKMMFDWDGEKFIDHDISASIEHWNSRSWVPSDPREKRQRPTSHAWQKTRQKVFERDLFVCFYCGDESLELECDHYIPVSRGGGNEIENLVTSCRFCNRKKGNKMPDVFLEGMKQ